MMYYLIYLFVLLCTACIVIVAANLLITVTLYCMILYTVVHRGAEAAGSRRVCQADRPCCGPMQYAV